MANDEDTENDEDGEAGEAVEPDMRTFRKTEGALHGAPVLRAAPLGVGRLSGRRGERVGRRAW
ncbi:hypothetical protein [Parafrankia sp. BMG5.11]|uniref:hypothetical protein n=1 Tax=Parafrankia sp. BMG5.11 TaxID=222540 RepID=UPI001A9F6155|nr:hypothetical protein [Parafrankia sp. BMG5.11]